MWRFMSFYVIADSAETAYVKLFQNKFYFTHGAALHELQKQSANSRDRVYELLMPTPQIVGV